MYKKSMSDESLRVRKIRPIRLVDLSSVKTINPPPSSPATTEPSPSTIHEHLARDSSGTDASNRLASASASGSNARCSARSNLTTTRAAQRQNRQASSKNSTGRGIVDSGISALMISRPLRAHPRSTVLAARTSWPMSGPSSMLVKVVDLVDLQPAPIRLWCLSGLVCSG